jgi:hypothetical protein
MKKFIKQNKLLSAVIVVLALVAISLYASPNNDTAVTKTTSVSTSSDSSQTASNDVENSTTAHFARYTGTSRDPFIPGVALDNPDSGGPGSLVNGSKWQLTGINSINGITSALIENADTSVFLKVGDRWNGLRVASISDDAVNFINSLGQVTQLGFAPPPEPADSGIGGLGTNAPSVSQVSPLPPLSPGNIQSFAGLLQNGGGQ